MNNEDLIKLIQVRPEGIIHFLILNQLVEIIDSRNGYTLDNIKPSTKGLEVLGPRIYFTEEWFTNLKRLWPSELRGNSKLIKDGCEKFISKTSTKLDVIEDIVKHWLKTNEKPYCGKMENFFYSIKGEEEISRAEQMLEIYKDIEEQKSDYRFEQV